MIQQSTQQTGKILSEALPYIQRYHKKIVVIKYGGNAMTCPELQQSVINDIVLLNLIGIHVVVVHGGGPEISNTLKKMKISSHFINGQRVTTPEIMEVVQMVLCGKINKHLAHLVQQAGGYAIGLCGLDSALLKAKKITATEDYGLVGQLTQVNTQLIHHILEKQHIPIIASVASGEQKEVLNINADLAATQIAIKLKAEKLIFMTDVAGVLRDRQNNESLISSLSLQEIKQLHTDGVISEGMLPKLSCCTEAIQAGVKRVHIIDGRTPQAILIEMLSEEGIGTLVTA